MEMDFAPMMLDAPPLHHQEYEAPYGSGGDCGAYYAPAYEGQQQQHYSLEGAGQFTTSPPGCGYGGGAVTNSSQRSVGSVGCGLRDLQSSPDSFGALDSSPAALLAARQQRQQLALQIRHQQQQLALQQQFAAASAAARGHQPHYDDHAGSYSAGLGSIAELEAMRAHIAEAIAMREELLHRTQALAAEVQRREAVSCAAADHAPAAECAPGDRSSAIEAARQLKALLSSLPPEQRRAAAADLMRRRGQLLAAGAAGGALHVAAAALEHCQAIVDRRQQAGGAGAALQLAPQLSSRASHHGDARGGGGGDDRSIGWGGGACEVAAVVAGLVDGGAAHRAGGGVCASVSTSVGSHGSPAGAAAAPRAASAASPGLALPGAYGEDADHGLLLSEANAAAGAGDDAGLLEGFLDDFLASDDDDEGGAGLGDCAGGSGTAAGVAAALQAQLNAAGPVGSGVSSQSAMAAAEQQAGRGHGRTPSFSAWAASEQQGQARSAGGSGHLDPLALAIGEQHAAAVAVRANSCGAWDTGVGRLMHGGMHPAHAGTTHASGLRGQAGAQWAAHCSTHAVRSSAPGHCLADTPFARAENAPAGFDGSFNAVPVHNQLQRFMSAPANMRLGQPQGAAPPRRLCIRLPGSGPARSGSLTLRKRDSGSLGPDAGRAKPAKWARSAGDEADSAASAPPPRPPPGPPVPSSNKPPFSELVTSGTFPPGEYEFDVGTAVGVAAVVLPRGAILYGGEEHGSISSFALAAARSVNPARSSCDGWREVRLAGLRLEAWRRAYVDGVTPPDAPQRGAAAAAAAVAFADGAAAFANGATAIVAPAAIAVAAGPLTVAVPGA